MTESDPDFVRNTAELARKAYTALAAALRSPPPHLAPSFRLWHYPAAGPQVSWAMFVPKAGGEFDAVPRARKTAWDRDSDWERLQLRRRRHAKVEPTLTSKEFGLDSRVLEKLMAGAEGLGLPRHRLVRPYLAEQRPEFGIEGFDIEGRRGHRAIVSIEWERNPPPLLVPVAYWADMVRQWLLTQEAPPL